MKKIKLLMPLFATTSLVAATTAIASCNKAAEKVGVTVENVKAETVDIQPTISSTEAIVGKKFTATLSWTNPSTGFYYVDSALVKIGDKKVEEYNEVDNPHGFHLANHTLESVAITIPRQNITKKVDIKIEVIIKYSNASGAIAINEYESEYISQYRGGSHELIATYDVLRSAGSYPTDKEHPEKFIKVNALTTYEFAFDLTKWSGPLDNNGSLFALMGFWNKTSDEFEQLFPVYDWCGEVWYGESSPTPIECTWTQTTAAFEFHCPKGGWGAQAKDRKTLFFRYTFFNEHQQDYFQIVVGQEHKD